MDRYKSSWWKLGVVLARVYLHNEPVGWRLTLNLGYHRLSFGKDLF